MIIKFLKRSIKGLAVLSGSILAVSLHTPASAEDKIHLVTEQYAPYNYEENGELKGLSVELMHEVMQRSNIDYDMELQPWARALSLAETREDYCVFLTVHTEERNDRFKWVEPLVTSRNFLTKLKGSNVEANSIEEARHYIVGTQRGDYTVKILKDKGFDRLDITSEVDLTLNKLLHGRIDLMPMADATLYEKQAAGMEIEPLLVLVSVINSLACNLGMPDEQIAKMQQSLDEMAVDGTKERILKKYGFQSNTP